MSSFKDDFRQVWHKPDNGIARIIIINVAIFVVANVLELFTINIDKYLTLSSSLQELAWEPWTLFTHFVTHLSFGHLFWNMITLYWFGEIFIQFLGNRKMIALYILGGLAGGLAYLVGMNLIPGYSNMVVVALGASAAVNAIVVGAATLMPDYKIHLFLIGPVKLKYLAAVLIILAIIGLRTNTGSEMGHLGGALMGFVFIRQLKAGNDWSLPILGIIDWVQNLFKPKPKLKVSYRNKQRPFKKSGEKNNSDQIVIDKILDKIHESGYEKLTEEEKQILFKASQDK